MNGAIMNEYAKAALSKVPEVTIGFWIIKILATTIGETGGDAVTMSLFDADKDAHNGGYLIGTGLFMAVFVACVIVQIAMKKFHPAAYWLTIVATTTVGTTMADFADRSLGIGYAGGSSLLFALLMASFLIWRWSEGTVSVNSVATPRAEAFYWTTILFSQTLGTALGDWMADTNSLDFGNASGVRGRAGDPRGGLSLYQRVAGAPVLGRLHPHPLARRDARRPVRQANRPGRARLQPLHGDRDARRSDGRHNRYLPTTSGRPSPLPFGDASRMTYDGSWRRPVERRGRIGRSQAYGDRATWA
jgi:uncharacterized membrane-anchored protein